MCVCVSQVCQSTPVPPHPPPASASGSFRKPANSRARSARNTLPDPAVCVHGHWCASPRHMPDMVAVKANLARHGVGDAHIVDQGPELLALLPTHEVRGGPGW